ncbi:hypothetical protein Tco_0912997 [Tanacetum coccineum]
MSYWRPSSGVKLVGVAVSRDSYFISGLAMRRATNAVDLMSLPPQLHDPQNELLLLRSYMGIAKLFFGLRICQPVHMEEADLCGSIENIVVCGGPFFETYSGDLLLYPFDLVWHNGMDDDHVYALALLLRKVCYIPSFDFSGFTNKDIVPSKAQQTPVSVLFSEMVKDLEAHFDGLSQHMSSVEYHTILKNRLMISLFLVDAICPVCRKAYLDSFGEHAVHCKELPGFKYNTIWLWTSFLTYVCVPGSPPRRKHM